MAKYPVSCLDGSASAAFLTVLQMHLDGEAVLDLTYGDGLSWGDAGLFAPAGLVRSDIKPPFNQDLFTAAHDHPEWRGAFDLVYFDPPYFFGVEASTDPRAEQYGRYDHDGAALSRYMAFVPEIATFLRSGGKVIVKCGDQYHVPSRRLMLHHIEWCGWLTRAFSLVDFYVYRYHRVSPTAYQVKDRPCAVVAHSYFIVGQLPGDGRIESVAAEGVSK